MSTQPPRDAPGPLDHLALRYLRRALDTPHPSDEPFVLNEYEQQVIGLVRWETLAGAAGLGVVGVLVLYLPQFVWPSFFAPVLVVLGEHMYALPLQTILYGLLLVYLEIYALLYVNGRAVRIIMAVCQFPRAHDTQYERHLHAMAEAARQRYVGSLLQFGLHPYPTRPHWGLSIYLLMTQGKALVSNLLVRVIGGRLPLTTGIRPFITLVAAPIWALWDAWASASVIHETKIRVMAPITIRCFVDELHEEWQHNDAFCQLIPDALQFMAIQKRQYNYAHLLLTETLLNHFGLAVINPNGRFLERLTDSSTDIRRGIERLIIFSVLIDGRLSWFEKQRLRQLKKCGYLTYDMADITALGQQFNQGKGLWV